VGAELVLDAGAELGQHLVRYVGRALRHEEQLRLVEEEHQLRLVDVAHLGQVVEQVGQQPHQEGREDGRPALSA
jgi:hypothetical protein